MPNETAQEIAGGLPEQFPSSPDSGNYKLLEPVGKQADAAETDIEDVDKALTPQTATSKAQLRELGKLVGVLPDTGESLEEYRARVLARYAIVTSEGTIDDLLTGASTLLSTPVTEFGFEDVYLGERGAVFIGLPSRGLANTPLSNTDVAETLDEILAASYRLEAGILGTFTYITPLDYDQGNHQAELGYDGLDSNGDPKDNGGTYAGLIT